MSYAITQQELKSKFKYNKYTGIFTRKNGTIAGTLDKAGYRYISIYRKKHAEHRIAFLYVYGYIPEEIDHINRIRNDNRIINLRAVTRYENSINCSLKSNNKSGVNGVHSYNGSWRARITVRKKVITLGIYKDINKAIVARQHADKIYKFNNGY